MGCLRFYHGTRRVLDPGEPVPPGDPAGIWTGPHDAAFSYASPDLDAAIWSAELAAGDAAPRVYLVEALDEITDAAGRLSGAAPRHPFLAWRSHGPLRVVSEVTEWRHYHGTRAALRPGDLLIPGRNANYGQTLRHVYFTRTLDAAVWAAELALGDGPQRIYIVEPTGPVEDDPNVTGKRFRGNPTKSFRSRHPLRVAGELREWNGHPEALIAAMKGNLERLTAAGSAHIED